MPRVQAENAEIGIYTWGTKVCKSAPRPQYLIDVVGLRDPQSNRGFKKTGGDGRDPDVQTYVSEDPRVAHIVESVKMLSYMHLRSEGRDNKWLSFGLADHHGRWIAPAVGELVARSLDLAGYKVYVYHADL